MLTAVLDLLFGAISSKQLATLLVTIGAVLGGAFFTVWKSQEETAPIKVPVPAGPGAGSDTLHEYWRQSRRPHVLKESLMRRFFGHISIPIVGLCFVGAAGVFLFPELDQFLRGSALPLTPLQIGRPNASGLLVFVHGWNGDAAGTWRRFPDFVRKDRRFASVDIQTINYPTYMARRGLGIEGMGLWLLKELRRERLNREPRYEKLAFLSHSMGGLITRLVVLNAPSDQTAVQLPADFLVDVASPHDGANSLAIVPLLALDFDLIPDLKQGSSFLRGMQSRWSGLQPRPGTSCYSSEGDYVVPLSSAFFDCDRHQQTLKQWGHTELVKPDSITDERYENPVDDLAKFFH